MDGNTEAIMLAPLKGVRLPIESSSPLVNKHSECGIMVLEI